MRIFVGVLLGCVKASTASGCCLRKVVGEVEYTLVDVDKEGTEANICKNSCLYTTEEGGRFCLPVGELESTCVEHLSSTTQSKLAPTSTTKLSSYGGLVMIGGYVSGKYKPDNIQVLGACTYVLEVGSPNHMFGAGVSLGSEFIYVCGGYADGKNPTNMCSVINLGFAIPVITIQSMNTPRVYFTMNNVDSKQVVVGGVTDGENVLDSVEILSGVEDFWTLQSYTITPPRHSHCTVTISSSSILMIGGRSNSGNSGPISTIEQLDISTGVETFYSGLSKAIYGHSCSVLAGEIILAGGIVDGDVVNTVYSLEIVSGSKAAVVKNISNMVFARAYFSMGVVDGQLTAYSGYSEYGDGFYTKETRVDGEWETESADPTRQGSVSVQVCLDQ